MAEPIIVWNTRDPLFGRIGAEYKAEARAIFCS
jgi:hypothetical protein